MVRLPVSLSLNPVAAALLSGIVALVTGCDHHAPPQSEIDLEKAREANPVEAVKQQLNDRINRYHHGEAQALSFLPHGVTNISVVRVTPSNNTNLPSVDAVLLADGKRHYLEIPISLFPMVFIPTLPPPPAEPEFRRYLDQQVDRAMKGKASDLKLPPQYHWTNLVIESVAVASNYTVSYPYRAEGILSAQALVPNQQDPVQFRLSLHLRYLEEDHWFLFFNPITP